MRPNLCNPLTPSSGSCLGSCTPLGAIEGTIDVTGAMGPVAGMDPGSMFGIGPGGPDRFCGAVGPKCPCGPSGPVGPKGPDGMEGGGPL